MPGWPKQSEKVVLTVNGRDYTDWETVKVVHDAFGQNPPYQCRFTCSEALPLAKNFATLQIKPGMKCAVSLAGQVAFNGTVMTRQVYLDANRHNVEIIAGVFPELMTSSVITKNGEWKNKTFEQIAKDVLDKFGVQLVFEGGPPSDYKFPRIGVFPGESPIDLLDKIARAINVRFSSNAQGDFVAIVGNGGNNGSDGVTEGENMLTGREIIFNQNMSSTAPVISQGPGNNQDYGAKVAHGPYASVERDTGFGGEYPPGVTFLEVASSDKQLLESRSTTEQAMRLGSQITVKLLVYGWQRPSDRRLWTRDQDVIVNSPSLIMHGDVLKLRTVTFTQDPNGTRTELTLVNPLAEGKTGVIGGIK